ncbi:hypothetical protein OIU76_015102 [Salix suchowensis]|nr:hypothetical protein OIU76_015102 [Salix suchowensis]
MHVAVFAFPFGCHALALINLVQKLARAAQETQFSFLNTEKSNNSIFSASITSLPDNIKTYNVADGVPQSHVFSGDPIERVELFIKETPKNFKMALETAVAETGQEISCLIADANSCGDGHDVELEEKTLEIPGLSELHIADLPVEELYPEPLLNDLKSKFSNLLNVGFISLSMPPPSLPPSTEDTTGCLSWLDSQKSKTVAYISFGTVVNIPRSEMEELAEALEESRIPFLWSLRENVKGLFAKWIPRKNYNARKDHFFADNKLNARLVADVWRIGERIDGGVFTKTGVARSLDLILQHEQGKKSSEQSPSH